jgi:periplasmic protein TonB
MEDVMAYVDTKPYARKQGMAVALLINGAGVAAAFLMTTTVMDEEVFEPSIVTLSDTEKTRPPPKADQKKQPVQPLYLPPQTSVPAPTVPIEPIMPGPDPFVPTPPVIPDPQPLTLPDPPAAAAPIIKAARPDPRFSDVMQPEYPESAIRREISGRVTVRVKVGKDGRVAAVEIVRSSDDVFSEATLRHATRKWRFIPATRDGQPEESWREMTVRFELPN